MPGPALFDFPSVSQAPSQLQKALQQCHLAQVNAPLERSSRVKVKGRRIFRVPGGTMKLVAATCTQQHSGNHGLFESSSAGLPADLMASPALVQMTRGIVIYNIFL